MKRILVTGFEPFGSKKTNTSQEALAELQDIEDVHTLVLPVEFGRAATMAADYATDNNVDTILSLGEKPGFRPTFQLEQRAHNLAYAALIPDNAGVRTISRVDPEAAAGWLPATLDYTPIEERLDSLGLRHRRSQKAGKFVCNALLFGLLKRQQQGELDKATDIGFIHLSHVSDETAAHGVREIIETLLDQD